MVLAEASELGFPNKVNDFPWEEGAFGGALVVEDRQDRQDRQDRKAPKVCGGAKRKPLCACRATPLRAAATGHFRYQNVSIV